MTDRSVLLAKLARLSAIDAAGRHLADRLCEAGRVILGADGAWITVPDGSGHGLPLSTTDRTAFALADLQDVVGEGPGRAAFRDGVATTTVVGDQPDLRWAEFSRAALERVGQVTIHAVPMRPDHGTFGVLSLYVRPGSAWAESDDAAQFLADVIGTALLRDPVPEVEPNDEGGMWSARAQVYQATGMVIAQLGVPADDALALLRAHAYAHETTLAAIADEVVTRRLNFRGES